MRFPRFGTTAAKTAASAGGNRSIAACISGGIANLIIKGRRFVLMRQRRLAFLGAVITATCLFAKVTVDYDHKADFIKYHTYSWIGVNVQDPAWKDITANAIDAQLAAKGWQKVASGGDVSVTAMGATRTEQKLETWYTGGFGGGWFHQGWWGPGVATTTI